LRKHLLIILLLASYALTAQNEANIWYFGEYAGLDFNSGSPVVLTDGQLFTWEGCATISDTQGDLLFYTDGVTVYNKNHAIMANGTGLKGDSSSVNSAIIVPKPGNPNNYFIFTIDVIGTEAVYTSEGFNYSEVDMSLNGGLGAVIVKNIFLSPFVNENVVAFKKTDSENYWVISHPYVTDEYNVYEVSASGVNTTPNVIAVGNNTGYFNKGGQLKISPDGETLADVRGGEAQIFDFNASTGNITNPRSLDFFGTSSYGVEFSSNSKVLYVSYYQSVQQYNLNAGSIDDINNSKTELMRYDRLPFSSMQMGPDGIIYIAKSNQLYLDAITNPNVIGLGCNYSFDHIYLQGRKSHLGLPTFVSSFFSIEGIQFNKTCFGEAMEFSLVNTADSVVWDFGDPVSSNNTSSEMEPQHVFSAPGNYEVTATATLGTETAAKTTIVTVYETPIAYTIPDQIICNYTQAFEMNIDLSVYSDQFLNGQDPNQFSITYYDGISNYNDGIPLLNPPILNLLSLASADPVASVRNINNPECEAMTSFRITIMEASNPSSTIPNLTVCDNTSVGTDTDGLIIFDLTQHEDFILNGQLAATFSIAYFKDATLTMPINTPNSYQNTNAQETIYVKITNAAYNACAVETSFNIEVLNLPIVNPSAQLKQCDDDLDGYSTFNLNEIKSELSANHQNELISFFVSQQDANANANPITNFGAYTNQIQSTDTVWARVQSTNGCYRTARVDLIVSTTQIPITYTKNFYQCDDDSSTTDGIALFDFSSVNSEIETLFPVGQQLIINYYRNQLDALLENDPILDISNYQNTGYPNMQQIFIRVDSALDNDCLGLGQHITLTVERVPIANPVTVAQQCDADGNGMYAFQTTNIESQLLNGQTNVVVTYTDQNGNALSSPLPNPFVTTSQIVTARVTNATSQDSDGSCYDETQINFNVEPAAVAHPVQDLVVCEDDMDGYFAFDTATIENTLLNGQTNMLISYTDANGNALPSPLPNPFNTQTQTITAKVHSQTSTFCYDDTTIAFVVSKVPNAFPIADDIVCDDISNDGEHTYYLADYNNQILGNQLDSDFEVLYFENLANAQNNSTPLSNAYIVNTESQTIYARIQNRSNHLCYDINSFELGVFYQPIANQPPDMQICDDNTNDGYEVFDLTVQSDGILNGQSFTENGISFFLSENDALSGTNLISEPFTNTENSQTIYARIENKNHPTCFDITSFNIYVRETPVLLMKDLWPICEGTSVELIAEEGFDNYLWSTGETSRIITVDAAGQYIVTATNIYDNLTCETTKTLTVTQSNIATIIDIETVDWSQNNNRVTIFVEGNGDYEYSLDGIIYQDSNEFSNLNMDDYMVYVRDKNGCGIVNEDIYLLFYPKFFTPNNDSFNDTWQLYNANRELGNKIYIFDRYGKLITQLSSRNSGWDGTFNGSPLPSNDYWFILERQNGKTYKGHFTLKR